MARNQMTANDLAQTPILDAMPGPWGRALKQLRLQKGLTRQTVAKRAGMTPGTYGKIELGGHTLTSQLQALADVFRVPIEDVLIAPEQRVGRVELERRLRIAIAVAMQPMDALGSLSSPMDRLEQAFEAADAEGDGRAEEKPHTAAEPIRKRRVRKK